MAHGWPDGRPRRGPAQNLIRGTCAGACLHCHASNLALYRYAGKGDVTKGFEVISGMPYADAREMKDEVGRPLIQHPVSCVDCHDPKTMGVRVTRPGFIAGIKALKARQGTSDDFVAAENSMGFHAPQEAARILGEAIDYARQGQISALKAESR